MRAFKRSERIADQIKRDIAGVVSDLVQDRIGAIVTVSRVEVSDDLKYAHIHYTVLNENPELMKRVQELLTQRTKHVQMEIARHLRIRRVPEVAFHYDEALVESLRVARLIEEVTAKREHDDDTTENS